MNKIFLSILILSFFTAIFISYGATAPSLSPFYQSGSNINQNDTTAKTILNQLQISSSTVAGYVLTTDASGNSYWAASTGTGASFAWTPGTNYNTNINSTTTPIWFKNGLMASTTSYLVNASTSLLTVSDSSYLGTVKSGVWNGTAIGDAYLTKSGDWTGTFNGQTGTYYLNAGNLTNFGTPFFTFFSATNTNALAEGANNLYWTNNRFDTRLTATTTLPQLTTLVNLATVGTITSGTWNGTAIAETKGGTNQTTYTTGDILYSNNTNTLTKLGIGTGGFVLGSVSGVPGWVATSTLSTITGTLTVAKGGTGVGTFTSNGVLYGNGTGNLSVTTQGGANSVLTANAGAPSFSASPILTNITATASSTIGGLLTIGGNATTTGQHTFMSGIFTPFARNNSGASYTVDFSTGKIQKVTLTANTTLTYTGLRDGIFGLNLCQDFTGSRTVTFPSNSMWGGITPATTTISTASSTCNMLVIEYDTDINRPTILASSTNLKP